MIIFASNNVGKINEIKTIFDDENIISLKEANIEVEIEENKDTFYGNALKKAQEIFFLTGIPTIADDSGLCIHALDNFPGVLTHRFLGDASDEERNLFLIKKCQNLKYKSASAICVLVYFDGENIVTSEGILKGKITDSVRGTNGFGFDSIFELDSKKTLAELTQREKNVISARHIAAEKLKEKLNLLKKRGK